MYAFCAFLFVCFKTNGMKDASKVGQQYSHRANETSITENAIPKQENMPKLLRHPQ